MLLRDNGMLLGNVDPLLQLTVMYPFAIYGSTVSDLDHNWDSCPSKDIVSYLINKILHLTTNINKDKTNVLSLFNAKHRSWQTHSDMFLVLMMLVGGVLMGNSINTADQVILRLITVGMVLGILSHMVLDMLTPEGIWCILFVAVRKAFNIRFLPRKISFVPNTEFFRTGGTWERIIRWLMWVACFFLFVNIILTSTSYGMDFMKALQ